MADDDVTVVDAPAVEPVVEPAAVEPAPAVEPEATWFADIKDPDTKKFASESTDVEALARRALQARQQLSTALVIPGADAPSDEVSAYRAKIGASDEADKYQELLAPAPEGHEFSEGEVANRLAWSERFRDHNVPLDTAAALIKAFNDDQASAQAAIQQADKTFVEESDRDLRAQWPGDQYNTNRIAAKRAFDSFAELAGVEAEELSHMKTAEDRFILDDPRMLRVFASIGTAMRGGDLGPQPLSQSQAQSLNEQIKTVVSQIATANADGNTREANRLYQVEQDLRRQQAGGQPIVGSQGRAA